MQRIVQCLVIAAMLAVGFGVFSATAAYPDKQITCLQASRPGGGSDALAQITQPVLEKYLGKGFINQYLPGASGSIAFTRIAKQTKPDGYTVTITFTPHVYAAFIMNPKEITYRMDDFDPIANVVTDPNVLVVSPDSPLKTFDDFIQACKAKPGTVTVSNSGLGGDDALAIMRLEKIAGIKAQLVPFDSDAPSWQAAMAKKVDVSMNNLGVVYPQVKAGNLRVLGILSEKRYHLLPDVPTVKELGYNLVGGSSRGYSAPKGLPADVKATLIDAFKKMAADPDFIKACENRALAIDMKYGDDYAAFFKEQVEIVSEIMATVQK